MKTWLSGGVLQQNQRENRNVPIVNFMDTGHLALPGIWTSVSTRRFKSEVQQGSIDGMAE